MLRSLRRFALTASLEAGSIHDVKQIIYRSDVLTNHELVNICKRISEMTISEIRININREEFLKTFSSTLVSRAPYMDTGDLVSIVKDLVKNPDFRDLKNTFNLWHYVFRNLVNRVDGLTLTQITDILNSLSFIRISNVIFDTLVEALKERMTQMEIREYSMLPLSKFSSLLWSLNQHKVGISKIYINIYEGLINHSDFEFMTFDQIAMIVHFYFVNKALPDPESIIRPFTETLKSALEEDKFKSIYELIDVIHYMTQIPDLSDDLHERMCKLLILKKDDLTAVSTITRISSSNLKATKELQTIVIGQIFNNYNLFSIIDIVTIFKSSLLKNFPYEKKKLLEYLRRDKLDISTVSFSNLEKCLNMICYMDQSDMLSLFLALEDSFYNICLMKSVNESLLLRLMRIVMKLKIKSPITKIFITKICMKHLFPHYHTRDMMLLSILIAGVKELQTHRLLEMIDDKIFRYSHLFEYHEMSVSLYFLSRINRICIETQELLTKRLSDKDLNMTDVNNFTNVLVSNVMNNSSEYARRYLPIVRLLMSFKSIANTSYLKLGEVMKKMDSDFDINWVSFIRCLWILAYLDIKDSRFINSGLWNKIKDVLPNIEPPTEIFIPDDKTLDLFHLSILVQSLGILGKDFPEIQIYSENIQKILESSNPCFDEMTETLDDIRNVCDSLGFKVERNKNLYGNTLPLWINDFPVVVYENEHYRHQSYLKNEKNPDSNLQGFFLMRKKFWDSVGVKYFEIESSLWNLMNDGEKQETIKSFFS